MYRLPKKERKYKDKPTSELLDFVGQNKEFGDKDYDKKSDMQNEIEERAPFKHIQRKIDRMQNEINELSKEMRTMKKHKHFDKDGTIVIPLKD